MIPALSVIFPVFNEAAILKDNLFRVIQTLEQNPIDFEIILVDDGSSDRTGQIAGDLVDSDHRLRLLTLRSNMGKGGALKEGVSQSRGKRVLFSDMDLSVSFLEWPVFQEALDNGFDLAIGSRRVSGAQVLVHQPLIRQTLGQGFTLLSRFLLNSRISDFTCGFKAFKGAVARDLFSRLTLSDWSFDAELLYLANCLGYRTCEIPVAWSNRAESRVRLRKDLWSSLIGLFKIRWRHRKVRSLTRMPDGG